MPKNFFILGLPRSRTAWMSVFFTTTYTYCYHEGLKDCENIEGYKRMIARDDYLHVGDSDSGLIHIDLGKLYPNSPVIIIKRDIHEVADSMINLLGHEPGEAIDRAYGCRDAMHNAIRHCNNVMKVDYSDINDKLEDIWSHCIGEGFDRNRAEHLIEMNIQTQFLQDDKYMNTIKSSIDNQVKVGV